MPLIIIKSFVVGESLTSSTTQFIESYELLNKYPQFMKLGVKVSAFLNRVMSQNKTVISEPRKDYLLETAIGNSSFKLDVSNLVLDQSIAIDQFPELWLNSFVLESRAFPIFPKEYKIESFDQGLQIKAQQDLQASIEAQEIVRSLKSLQKIGLTELMGYLEDGLGSFSELTKQGDQNAITNFRKVVDGLRQHKEKFSESDSRDERLRRYLSSCSDLLSNFGMHPGPGVTRDESILAREITLGITRYITSKLEFEQAANDAYVIDWSRPVGTFTGSRVVVVADEAFYMGGEIDDWARRENLRVVEGTEDDFREYLKSLRIKDVGSRPLSEIQEKRKKLKVGK